MALVPASELYEKASKEGYAVGVFPANSMDAVQGVLEAVKKAGVPALLTISNLFFDELNDLDAYVHYVRQAVKRVGVPVALHLDHGNVQTFEEIKKCVGHGFTSVMFDASRLPLEENIRQTREATEYCHQRGVTVEGMIGHMPLGDTGEFNEAKKAELGLDGGVSGGGSGSGSSGSVGGESGGAGGAGSAGGLGPAGGEDAGADSAGAGTHDEADHYYTRPEEAERFGRETGVDVMAVSVGTIHGLTTRAVSIDEERLKEINRRTDAYLTIHGGSGLPAKEIRKLVRNGVVKINVFSGIARRLTSHLREKICEGGEEMIFLYGNRYVIEDEVMKYIKLFTWM
jgi:fructose-bisphosphate aldolase class II